jgi:hypothetical protein
MSDQPASPAPVDGVKNDLPLVPLPAGYIPENFAKSADPSSPPPMRMMAARAMAPIPPKNLVPIIYQLMMDPDPKIAAAAEKSFRGLDDKLLTPVLADPQLPEQILEALCHTLVEKFTVIERVLLNKRTPDAGFVWVAEHAADEKIINVVVENQERLLRNHDIVRGLGRNPRALRSDLDRAIDFLVREGVFLEDMPEFEDSFVRLGKSGLEALKKVKIREEVISEETRAAADAAGLSAEDFLLQGGLTSEDLADEIDENTGAAARERKGWHEMSKAEKMKAAYSGGLEFALEAIRSPNKAIAVAGINNPKVTEAEIPKILRSKSLCDDVVRVVCNNGDWTKSYEVKKQLIEHPKTPISLVMRWLPLMRQGDLKSLSKSKSIPGNVAMQAKRLLDTRGG